jgi:serine/threonine protein kinase
MSRKRRNGGDGCLRNVALCDRFNGVAVTVILVGFCLEVRMSFYTATFLTEAQKARATTERDSPIDAKGDRTWSPRVVTSWGEPPSSPSLLLSSSTFNGHWSLWSWLHGDGAGDDTSWIHPVHKPSLLGQSPITHFTDECIPQADWQLATYTTCNLLHEVNVPHHSLLSMAGSWRSVWKVNTDHDLMVMKLLHLRRNFTPDAYYAHRIDALAMERLTFSPYVVNVFGFCGMSVLTEYADMSARDVIKDRNLSYTTRLRLARDLSLALSHVHTGPVPKGHIKRGHSSLSHSDLNIANAVHVGNVTKLNDFNLAMLIPWNVTSQRPCGMVSHFSNPLWKSPEEIANKSLIDPDRSDVYALGNILFQIFTKHQPWTHLEESMPSIEQVIELKLSGLLPHVPAKYLQTNRTEKKALYYAAMACFEPNPDKRLPAARLAQALDSILYLKRHNVKLSSEQFIELFSSDAHVTIKVPQQSEQ